LVLAAELKEEKGLAEPCFSAAKEANGDFAEVSAITPDALNADGLLPASAANGETDEVLAKPLLAGTWRRI